VEWLPVFVPRASCQIVTESLSFCHRAKELRVNAYVIMPTHLHMIVFDADWDNERLRRTLADLRKFAGRDGRGTETSEAWHGQETAPQRARPEF
jgi:putative transposase